MPTETISLSWKLHSKQREWFERPERYRIIAAGRRSGKNVFGNVDQVDFALNPEADPWGSDEDANCWWVAPTYNQAYDYGWGDDPNAIGATDLLPEKLIEDRVRSDPRKLKLTNGSVISYRTSDHPDSLDGAGVDHIVIDEAAAIPQSIWDDKLRPMLMDNEGKGVMISKPKGKNWFHEFYTRGQSDDSDWDDWYSDQISSYLNPFVADSEINEAAKGTPDRIFKQEYLAIFVDDGGRVFPGFKKRNVEDYDWQERNGNDPYVHGWDFARHQNWTVGITLDRSGLLVNFERLQDRSWPAIQNTIERVYNEYPGNVRLDASRDNKIVTDLEDNGLPVEAVHFSPQTKRDLIENLAVRLESGEITVPEIPQLVNELELFDYETTQSGNVRYHAPEGWHDDTVDALALAAKDGPGRKSATWGPGREVNA